MCAGGCGGGSTKTTKAQTTRAQSVKKPVTKPKRVQSIARQDGKTYKLLYQ